MNKKLKLMRNKRAYLLWQIKPKGGVCLRAVLSSEKIGNLYLEGMKKNEFYEEDQFYLESVQFDHLFGEEDITKIRKYIIFEGKAVDEI